MFGNTVGSLHVTRQYVVGTDGKDQLWSVSGSQGDNWVKAEVFIGVQSDFYLSIEAHRGANFVF